MEVLSVRSTEEAGQRRKQQQHAHHLGAWMEPGVRRNKAAGVVLSLPRTRSHQGKISGDLSGDLPLSPLGTVTLQGHLSHHHQWHWEAFCPREPPQTFCTSTRAHSAWCGSSLDLVCNCSLPITHFSRMSTPRTWQCQARSRHVGEENQCGAGVGKGGGRGCRVNHAREKR